MELGADAARSGGTVQPWSAAADHAPSEQEAKEEDESLGERADEASHGTTLSARAGGYVLLMVVVFVLRLLMVMVLMRMPARALHSAQHLHPAGA